MVLSDQGRREANPDEPKNRRSVLQLSRLETLTDVIYAIVLWRTFTLLPMPAQEHWGVNEMQGFFQDELTAFVGVAIGLAFTIIYWIQNNALMGDLERTDTRHTILSIVQLFFLLVFLRVIAIGVALEPSPANRAMEGAAAAMVGISAAWAWSYAIKHGLLASDVSDDDALAKRDRITAEPLTALFTIPFSFFPILWELTWFSYPAMIRLMRRRRVRKAETA